MKYPLNNRLSPRQKELLAFLGEDYCRNVIDGEPVIYRDFGAYDVEISGGHRKKQPVSIYVWQKAGGMTIAERHIRLRRNHEQVKALLDDITSRYMNREDTQYE